MDGDPAKPDLEITAWIEDRPVSRSDVQAWEARRAAVAFKRLGTPTPPGDVHVRREALVARKLELGHDAIEHIVRRHLRIGAAVGRLTARFVRGRKFCTVDLTATRGSCEQLPAWYHDKIVAGDEAPLLAGCPDHYILRTLPDGREEVIEVPGAGPLTLGIYLDDRDLSGLRVPADADFPVQWAAVGRDRDGRALGGGIRHQFRDDPDGRFRARLTVQFPTNTPPAVLREHRWHLACEFSNWIEMANGAVK